MESTLLLRGVRPFRKSKVVQWVGIQSVQPNPFFYVNID